MSVLYNSDEPQYVSNQREKILVLIEELSKKDKIIKELKSSSQNHASALAQVNTYKKEIELLKQKLQMSRYDKTHDNIELIEENSKLKTSEKTLSQNLLNKDKKIKELLDIISQYETQIASLSNQINITNQNNKQLKNIVLEMSTNYNKVKMKLINEKEEKKSNADYAYDIQYKKEIYETKIKELISLVKQYSVEIGKMSDELAFEKNSKNEIEDEYNKQNLFLEEITQEIQILNQENIEYKNQNEVMKKELECLTNELNQIRSDLYLKENEATNLSAKVQEQEILLKKKEMQYSNLITTINKDITNISKGLVTNFDNLIKEKNESENSEIKIEYSKENEVNFSRLVSSINSAYKNINEFFSGLRYQNTTLKNQISIIEQKHEKAENDLKELQDKKISNENIINNYLSEIQIKKDEIDKITKNFQNLNLESQKIRTLFSSLSQELFGSQTKENSEDNAQAVIQKIKSEREINKKKIENLTNENNHLSKKYKAAVTEIELKQIQIGNYEQIIDKKNESINVLREENKITQDNNKKLMEDNIQLITKINNMSNFTKNF